MTDHVEKLHEDLDHYQHLAEELTDPLASCLVHLVIADLIVELEQEESRHKTRLEA